MGNRLALHGSLGLLLLSSVGLASETHYRVTAEFAGREPFRMEGMKDEKAQALLDKNMRLGVKGSIQVKTVTSPGYKELPSILPDWSKLRLTKRTNSWKDDIYFAIEAGRATYGTKETLARTVPMGQRLLLAGEAPLKEAFANLKQSALSHPKRVAGSLKEKNKELTWQEGFFQEDIVFKEGRKKLAEFRLLQGGSLEIRRFHPKGHQLSVETWTPMKTASVQSEPEPLWSKWQIGAWVYDERDTGQAMHKRWQGIDKEPSSLDSIPVRATQFRMEWMAPGLAMAIGGTALLALMSLKKKPGPKT